MKVILLSSKARHGKDSTATILKKLLESDDKKVLVCHYADLLKYICKTFFGWNGNKDDQGRSILQQVGTDTIRKQNPNYWVNFISGFLKMFPDKWDYVIVADCRFPNEITQMKLDGWDVMTVRVNRLNYVSPLTEEQQNHPSETALDGYQFDYYIDSESGLDNLTIEVAKLHNYIKMREVGDINKT
jgi:hypothetical protein